MEDTKTTIAEDIKEMNTVVESKYEIPVINDMNLMNKLLTLSVEMVKRGEIYNPVAKVLANIEIEGEFYPERNPNRDFLYKHINEKLFGEFEIHARREFINILYEVFTNNTDALLAFTGDDYSSIIDSYYEKKEAEMNATVDPEISAEVDAMVAEVDAECAAEDEANKTSKVETISHNTTE